MAEECCGNCRFWKQTEYKGVCRRRPPVWTGPDDSNDEGMFCFPDVRADNWCGEWEPHREPSASVTVYTSPSPAPSTRTTN